jgi:calcineurin-like phosphoesterase family protein
MANFFISDTHFNHENTITKFEFRPFKDVDDMNNSLIRNWNERVKKHDTVYFLGDWCWKGNWKTWRDQLNGEIVFIKGNHDRHSCLTHARIDIGNLNILLQHIPPMMKAEIPDMCDLVLCGHVHSLWKHTWVEDVPVINCSVEQWKYRPISAEEMLAYYERMSCT